MIDSVDLPDLSPVAGPPVSGLASGYYFQTTPSVSLTTVATLGNGTLRLSPFIVPRRVTLTRIGLETTAAGDAGCTLRLGVYSDNGAGYPGALVLDAGTVPGDAVAISEITISQSLTRGLYWVGAVVQGVTTTQPTVRGMGTASGVVMPQNPIGTTIPAANAAPAVGLTGLSITGALPATFPTALNTSSVVPRIFVKVA